jgi:hypothetical protein
MADRFGELVAARTPLMANPAKEPTPTKIVVHATAMAALFGGVQVLKGAP